LKNILKKETDGIFTWLVNGAYNYLQSGLPKEPEAMVREIQEYRDINDKLSIFIREMLKKDAKATLGVGECYREYERWCYALNETPNAKLYFSANMFERGVHKRDKRTNKGEVFDGWRFRLPTEAD
jgi:phage/plasmid-associated DNA primase